MNTQLNNSVYSSNEQGIRRIIDNNIAMRSSNQIAFAKSMIQRPINNIKAYFAKHAEWKVCTVVQ
jgi:hypothetical protein